MHGHLSTVCSGVGFRHCGFRHAQPCSVQPSGLEPQTQEMGVLSGKLKEYGWVGLARFGWVGWS